MNKLTCTLVILTCAFSFISCGNDNNNPESSVESITTNDTIESEATTKETISVTQTTSENKTKSTIIPETTSTLTTEASEIVDFMISTSETTADIDNILISIVESKGILVTHDNANISFSAEQSVMNEIASEYCDKLHDNAESADTSNSTIKKMFINDTYDTIEFYVTEEFTSSMDSLAILLYAQPMSELQILTGKKIEDVHYTQKIIDVDTGEIIDEYIMPDDLSQ